MILSFLTMMEPKIAARRDISNGTRAERRFGAPGVGCSSGKPAHSMRVTLIVAMGNFYEEFKVKGQDLVDKVKAILHEGNVRRIILKDEKGHTFLEIPLSIAALGVVAAPLLAGLGAIAALVSNFTLVVERSAEEPEKKTEAPPS